MLKLFITYFRLSRLPTGVRIPNLPSLFFVLFLSVSSIFINIDFIIKHKDNLLFLYIIYAIAALYIIFLQTNILYRITIMLYTGIPFFRERGSFIKLIFYFLLNLFNVVISIEVLTRLYLLAIEVNWGLYMYTIINTLCISIGLYGEYITGTIKSINYVEIDDRPVHLNLLTLFLMSLIPLSLLINILYNYTNLLGDMWMPSFSVK